MRHNGSERVPAGEKMEKDEKGSVVDLIFGRGAASGCCHACRKEQFQNCKTAKCTNGNRALGTGILLCMITIAVVVTATV